MKKIMMTLVHGGWEYEFAKIGYPIIRLVTEEKHLTWRYKNTTRPAPPNVELALLSDFRNHLDDVGAIVVNDRTKLEVFKDIDKPKFFVPHTIENAEAIAAYQDYYHVIHTLKFTEDVSKVKGSLIYSSVSVDNYPTYDTTKTQPIIVSNCANVFTRPKFAGYELWRKVTKGLNAAYIGVGNELLVPAPFQAVLPLYEYVEQLREFRIFFNPTQESIMPMALYDALAMGMPIVTAATCGCPEIIQNGYNGYISNDPKELRSYIDRLLVDDKECMRIGGNARQSAIDFFNSDRMAQEWRALLDPYLQEE